MDHTHQNSQKNQPGQKVQESSKNNNGLRNRNQMSKIEILISFIEDTVRTLSNYGERIKNQLDINLIHREV